MNARISTHAAPRKAEQRGFILVTGLLFLVVMTMVALAMFRSTGLMERISANARDKQRAFEAAQSALQYGEWWLGANKPGAATSNCSTLASGDTVANIHVCTNAIQSDFQTTNSAWTAGFTYTPPNLSVPGSGTGTGGVVTASDLSSDVIYYNRPGFYLYFLGYSAAKGGNLYQVTAYGYGGSGNTASVLRSTYLVPTTGSGGGGGGGGLGGP